MDIIMVGMARHLRVAMSIFLCLGILFSLAYSVWHIYHNNQNTQVIGASSTTLVVAARQPPWSRSIPLSRLFRRSSSILGLSIYAPFQCRRKGWWQPHAQRMKMIDGPIPIPQIETRLYTCFDVTDSHFHRVWYVVGPIRRFGEGDAGGDCCYNRD